MFEFLRVDDADLMPLKKVLLGFWKFFHNDEFFFIGATIGKRTYREFCNYVTQYNLEGRELDSFIALNLKKDFRSLNLDESTGDKEISLALYHLKSMTDSIKFYPFINKIDPKLKKYFADIPEELPYFATVLWYLKLYKGLTATKTIQEDFVIDHFERFYRIKPNFFRESAYNIFNIKRNKIDGKIFIDLESLVEWEEIVYGELKPFGSFADLVVILKNNGTNIDDYLNNLPALPRTLLKNIRNSELRRELRREFSNLTKEVNNF